MIYSRTKPREPKVFSQFSTDFYLDDDGILKEKDIPKDDQAVVDSYFNTRLEALLDQYSDVIAGLNGYNVEFSDDVVEIDTQKRALDHLIAADQICDNFRSANPDKASWSRDQIATYLGSVYTDAVEKYKSIIKGETKNEENEVEQKGEQETVHEESK